MTEREKEIKELEAFFNNINIPTIPIQLNKAVTLSNAAYFIKHNLERIKSGQMVEVNLIPRLEDLRILKKLLS